MVSKLQITDSCHDLSSDCLARRLVLILADMGTDVDGVRNVNQKLCTGNARVTWQPEARGNHVLCVNHVVL